MARAARAVESGEAVPGPNAMPGFDSPAKQLDLYFSLQKILLDNNGTSRVDINFSKQAGDLVLVA